MAGFVVQWITNSICAKSLLGYIHRSGQTISVYESLKLLSLFFISGLLLIFFEYIPFL